MSSRGGFYDMMRQKLVGKALFGGGSKKQGNLPPLDDPVIDGIKCHLIISSRIGLEPIDQKFARIAFKCKRRMVMGFGAVCLRHQTGEATNVLLLRVTERLNDAVNECPFGIPTDRVGQALRSLFRHIRKWRFIHFDRFKGEELCKAIAWDGIVNQFLDAILTEFDDESIDVRRFHCLLRAFDEEKMARFLQLSASSLRRLEIPLLPYGDQPATTLTKLTKAIYGCQKLRRLWLTFVGSKRLPKDFISKILTLPHLNDLVLGQCVCVDSTFVADDDDARRFLGRQFPDLTSLFIDQDWLEAIGRLPQLPVLKNMQHFKLQMQSDENAFRGDVWRIVTEMRSPVHVDLDIGYSVITWQNVWNDFLPIVYKIGANVQLILNRGLPEITTEEFEAGLATTLPIIQNALTSPDLANAPIRTNRYQKLEFSFSGGAKVTFKTYWNWP